MSPAGGMAAGRGARPISDAVPVLTVFVVILLAIPTPMKVAALGQVGGPATVASVGCFFWWCWMYVNGSVPTPLGAIGGHAVRNVALAFLLVSLIVYANSASTPLPGNERSVADAALIRMVGSLGIVCLVADGFRTPDRLWLFLSRLTLALGAVSVLSLVQSFTGQIYVDRLSIPGLTPASGVELIKRGIITRPSGTGTHPIELAAVLAIGMPFAFAVAGHVRQHVGLHRSVAVLVPVTLLLIGSRTAIVCGVVAFAIMLWAWSVRTRLIAVGIGFVVLCATFVLMPGFLGTIKGMFVGASDDPSVTSRTDSYAIVYQYWSNHFWLGRGLGTFLPKYWILDNEYLIHLIGAGLVGLVALVALIGVAVWSGVATAARTPDPASRQFAVAAVASTSAGAVSLALFDAFSFFQASGMFFLAIGACGAVRAVAPRKDVAAATSEPEHHVTAT